MNAHDLLNSALTDKGFALVLADTLGSHATGSVAAKELTDSDKAKLLRLTLALNEHGGAPKNEIAHTLFQLAGVLQIENPTECEHVYKRAIDLTAGSTEFPEQFIVLRFYGSFLAGQRRYDEAIECFVESERQIGADNEELSETLSCHIDALELAGRDLSTLKAKHERHYAAYIAATKRVVFA